MEIRLYRMGICFNTTADGSIHRDIYRCTMEVGLSPMADRDLRPGVDLSPMVDSNIHPVICHCRTGVRFSPMVDSNIRPVICRYPMVIHLYPMADSNIHPVIYHYPMVIHLYPMVETKNFNQKYGFEVLQNHIFDVFFKIFRGKIAPKSFFRFLNFGTILPLLIQILFVQVLHSCP